MSSGERTHQDRSLSGSSPPVVCVSQGTPQAPRRTDVGWTLNVEADNKKTWQGFCWSCLEPPQMPCQVQGTLPSSGTRLAKLPRWDSCLSPHSKFRDKGRRLSNTFHGSQLRIKGSASFQETSFFVCKTLSFRKKEARAGKKSGVLLLPNHSTCRAAFIL